MKKLIVASMAIGLLASSAKSDIVTFDFRTNQALYDALDDQSGPVSFTIAGLTATFTASDGTMNRTTSGFGINSVSFGNDDTDAFDVGEWMTISFNKDVTITDVTVSSWNPGEDEGQVKIGASPVFTVSSTGSHVMDNTVSMGTALRIESTAGTFNNGWSLDRLAVNVVPEPATVTLAVLGGLITWMIRRVLRK